MSQQAQHDPKNEAEIAYWNSAGGRRWVERQQSQDIVLGPILQAVLERAQLRQGERVIDIGCGTGAIELAPAPQPISTTRSPCRSCARFSVACRIGPRTMSEDCWRSTQRRPPALFQYVISASFFGSCWVCRLITELHSPWHHRVFALPISE